MVERTISSGFVSRPRMRDMFQLRCEAEIRSIGQSSRAGLLESAPYALGNLAGKQGRNGISDLAVTFRPGPAEKVIVWKCLYPRCLAQRKASTLRRIVVDVVVAVFRDVARDF